ncbi:O-antigen polymerase [Peribacillus simplex]|uniref:O-antigen polymerase n=1 Tax=Peribacillus simplex TaxID=1478 RepID=UPI0033391FFB
MIILTSIYILLTLMLLSLVGLYYKNYKKIDVFVVFTLVYSLYYFIVPIIINFSHSKLEQENNSINYIYHIINSSFTDKIYALIFSFLGYVIFLISYKLTNTKFGKINISAKELQVVSKRKLNRIFLTFGYFMFIVGGLSFAYIVSSLGGLSKALQLADYLRNPNIDSSQYINQNILFLKTLGGLVLGAPYAFLGAYYIIKKKLTFLLFIFSLIVGTCYALFSAGKFVLITFIAGFIIHYLIRGKRTKILNILIFLLICLWLLPFLDFLFSYLATGGEREYREQPVMFSSLISQFAFPYSNLLKVQEMNQIFGLRWGIDLVNWIWNVIPSGILSFFGLQVTSDLSNQITLYYSMFARSTGGTPSDLLTYLISQFSVFGVFLMIIVGYLLKKINLLLWRLNFNDFSFIYIAVLVIPYSLVFNSEMVNILKYRISNVMLLIMLFFIFKLVVRKSLNEGNLPQ